MYRTAKHPIQTTKNESVGFSKQNWRS